MGSTSYWRLFGDGTPDPNPVILESGNTADAYLPIIFRQTKSSASRDAMTIAPNGYVGIGVGSPANALDVCGTIRANEIYVEIGWCDYVFDKGYKVMSLNDLEKYIKANHHLPEIPTSQEVEKEGVKVGKMTALLLKKIEESTLRAIEQQKKMDELSEENKELRLRLDKLENK